MASPSQLAAQLRVAQAQGSRGPRPAVPPSPSQPERSSVTNPTETETEKSSSPTAQARILRLSKSLATGGRDRKKSFVDQAAGEVAARGAQVAVGIIGLYIPIIGSVVGSALAKRIGRIFGEHWKIMLPAVAFFLFIWFFLWSNIYTIIFMLVLGI